VRVLGYNRGMRWLFTFAGITLFAMTAAAADQKTAPLLPCPPGTSDAACHPSRQTEKQARNAFTHGMKLQATAPDQAYEEFIHAADLVPRNVNYVTAREATREQLISKHIERGNVELESGKQVEALADFRTALKLDPANEFAQERVRDALGDTVPVITAPATVVEESPEISFEPNTNLASFHFRGDSKELLSTIALAYGVSAQIEDSVASRRVSFDIDNIDFFKAMAAVGQVTKSFWTPLDRKQMVIAGESTENRRQFERLAMRTFYIPGAERK